MRATAVLALIGALACACTGTIDDGGATGADGGDASSRVSAPAGGSLDAGSDSTSDPTDGSSASDDVSPEAEVPPTGTGVVCQTSIDSYGFTRCTCASGVAALGDAAVASCTGFDCCVRYGADSGLAAGFGDPALSSGLCGCFQSADITALLGAGTTCANFANDGVGTVVPTCP